MNTNKYKEQKTKMMKENVLMMTPMKVGQSC